MNKHGQSNMVGGLISLAVFMFLGFILVYLRDFAPDAIAWANSYATGKHFETRLAHVHGTLFGFLNVLVGYLLLEFRMSPRWNWWISRTGLLGLVMPIGILAEVLLGLTPIPVLVGAMSMTTSLFLLGIGLFKFDFTRNLR